MRYGAFRIAVVYLVISLLWITFSDHFLFFFQHRLSAEQILTISSGKGYFFVVVTALLLFAIIRSDDKKLKQSEQQYRSMYESNPNPMWIYVPGTLNFISVNDAAVATYGYSRNEFLKKTILEIRPPEDAEKVIASAARLENSINNSGIWRHLKKDGTVIYVSITSHKISFNGQPHVMVLVRDMTETILFEKRLEKINKDLQSEKRKLSETQRISRIGGWEFFPGEQKLLWSDEVYEIAGILKEDNRRPFDLYLEHIFPEDRTMMINALNDLIANGKQLDVTHRITSLEGSTRYIRQLAKIDSGSPETLKITGSLQDITELKMLKEERDRYQLSFESTLNSMSDAFFALNRELIIIRTNEAFRVLTGRDSSDIIGRSIFDLFSKEQNVFFPVYKKALEDRVICEKEDYSLVLDKWIKLAAYPTDEGVAVYFTDISEQRSKDARLKEAVERYELVAQATRDVVYDMNMLQDHLIYNTSLTHLINVLPENIGYNLEWWRGLIHPDDLAEVVRGQEAIIREGRTNWECEYRLNCGNGIYKYIIDQGYFVYDEQKRAIRLIGAVRDIDALKRSVHENRQLADMITRVNNMIIVTDAHRRVRWVNKAFEDMTGYNLGEIGGKVPAGFLSGPESSEDMLTALRVKQELKEVFSLDVIIYTKERVPLWIAAEFTPSYDESKKFQGYVTVCQNITFRKEKEAETKRQHDLLRKIAWMSSHEIRRPVATILGLVDLMNQAENEAERNEILPLLNRCATEMDQMVHEINNEIKNVEELH
jgi:PAS domain S-box-containing protein